MGGRGRLERKDPARLTDAEARSFGLTVGAAFLVLAGLLAWRGHAPVAAGCALLGAVLCVGGLADPGRLRPVESGWMAMAAAVSKVTTPLVMGLIYYLVLTPTGLVMRLLGRNPLRREPRSGSYWVDRDTPTGDLDRQF